MASVVYKGGEEPKVGDIVIGDPGTPHTHEIGGVVVAVEDVKDSITVAHLEKIGERHRVYAALAVNSWEDSQRPVGQVLFATVDPRNFRKVA